MDVDALIIELIESGRQATDEELSEIVTHVAQAPFAFATGSATALVAGGAGATWDHDASASLGRRVPFVQNGLP